MNWPLKGFCMPNPVFPPRSGLKLMVQLIRFCTREMPNWNTTNFISYLAREAGATPVQELAFILAPQGDSPLVTATDRSLTDATAEFQEQYISRAIDRAGGNMSQAADQLGLHRSNLYRKMRQLGMVTD